MELKKVTCPSCGNSEIVKINNTQYKCSFCNSTFTVDYDEEDARIVEAKKEILMQRERFAHEDKVRSEAKEDKAKNSKSTLIRLLAVILVALFLFCYTLIKISEDRYEEKAQSIEEMEANQEPEMHYLTADDYNAGFDLSEFKKAADTSAKNQIDTIYSGTWKLQEEPTLKAAYLLNYDGDGQNELWFIYDYYWVNDKGEESHRYQVFNFDEIYVLENGKIKSDYHINISLHSELLGNNLISGYSDFDSAYRENIMSKAEYTVTEISFGE